MFHKIDKTADRKCHMTSIFFLPQAPILYDFQALSDELYFFIS